MGMWQEKKEKEGLYLTSFSFFLEKKWQKLIEHRFHLFFIGFFFYFNVYASSLSPYIKLDKIE